MTDILPTPANPVPLANPAAPADSADGYEYGWHDSDEAGTNARRGINEDVVRDISARKNEPEWMLNMRLKGLRLFGKKPMPSWGADLSGIDFDNIKYYVESMEGQAESWEDLPEDIKNTYDRLGIPEAEKQRLVAGVAAQYECLSSGTRIWTVERGMIPIEGIEEGDRIFSLDEETNQIVQDIVTHVAQTGVEQTYLLSTGVKKIRATATHPFLVLVDERKEGRQRARYKRRWKTLQELVEGDIIAVPRGLPNFGEPYTLLRENEFGPEHTNADLMWLLGLHLGDGNIQHNLGTYRMQIAIPDTDPEVRQEIRRILLEQFDISMKEPDNVRIVANSKKLVEWFIENELSGVSKTKRVPRWVFTLPIEQKLAYLGGYVDADGYVAPHKSGSVVITSVNKEMLTDIQELALLCGLRPSSVNGFSQKHMTDPDRMMHYWRMQIGGDFERLDCRNPKRTERFGRRKFHQSYSSVRGLILKSHISEHLGFASVKSIDKAEIEPVWNIEVKNHKNFIAEGIIVHNSSVIYHSIREDLAKLGVIFVDTDTALREYPELFKEYFGTIIPPGDNKFAALNTAVWSGGSFIYVPKGVHVDIPLQAYFRINTVNMGQFERTLIVVDEDAYVHYIEGCSSPIYSSDSLHSAVVEIIVKKGGRCRYTTIQNWSDNVYNLVTKRAVAHAGATMEWCDGNIGSKVTMKYPAVWLTGEHAKGETLSLAMAGKNQHQDAGAKMVHAAPNTSSVIVSKSVVREGGRTSYRGLVQVLEGAYNSSSTVRCDALILDDLGSRSDTYPYVDVREDNVSMTHEATVSKVGEDQLFYLMSRGLTEVEAMAMIVRGFIEPIAREIPMEYALELNRLIEMQMEDAVG